VAQRGGKLSACTGQGYHPGRQDRHDFFLFAARRERCIRLYDGPCAHCVVVRRLVATVSIGERRFGRLFSACLGRVPSRTQDRAGLRRQDQHNWNMLLLPLQFGRKNGGEGLHEPASSFGPFVQCVVTKRLEAKDNIGD
jgi:hypothetical protein